MKRFFLFVAALCCMGMMSVNALAEKVYDESSKLYFELDDETLTAIVVEENSGSDNYNYLSGKVTIPAEITYSAKDYTVTTIGKYAFRNNTTITEYVLPEDGALTTIESAAFDQSALEKINIPSSVTAIPYSSFYKSALYKNDANYEDGILYIDGCLIAAKTSLEGEVTVNVGTRLIAGSAFTGCKNITEVKLPEGVKYIGCNAFNNCSALEQINFPASLNFIGDNAFLNCKLREVYLKSPLTIGKMAFFATTPSIQTVVLPKGESTFNDYAFSGQPGITRINVYEKDPSNLHMGTGVFDDVDKEKCIVYVPHELNGGSVSDFKATDAWSALIIQSNNVCADGLFFELNDVTKKMTLTYELYDSYFNYCTLSKQVDVASSISELEELGYTLYLVNARAFELASQITSITLPETVEHIGMMAFSDLNQMKEFTIPEKVNFIGEFAFAECTGLEKITNLNPEPQDITGKSVFYNVKKSEVKLMVPPGSRTAYQLADTWGSFDIEELPIRIGDLYYYLNDEDDYAEVTYQYELSEDNYAFLPENTKLVIPSEVTYNEKTYDVRYINSGAFRNCDKIYMVEIPGSVLIVGSSAFNGCKNLWGATLNEGVKSLEMSVFEGCSDLSKVSLPSSMKQIGNYAFANNNNPVTLIVNNETPIDIAGKHVFENTFQNILFVPAGSAQAYREAEGWKDFKTIIEKGAKVGELYYRFDKDAKTAMVTFEKNYDYDNYNSMPEELIIPEKVTYDEVEYTVTEIEQNAFLFSKSLKKVTLPATLEKIGDETFNSCYSLSSITCYAVEPPVLGTNVFDGSDCSKIPLYVPKASIDKYKAAEQWKEFIVEEMSNGVKVGQLYYIFDKVNKTATVTYEKYKDDKNYKSLPIEFVIPEKVTYDEVEYIVTAIGDYAFWSAYTSFFEIPASITSIGEYAFANIIFAGMILNSEIPIDIQGKHVFENTTQELLLLPAGSAQAYKAAEGWKDFSLIIEQGIKVGNLYYSFNKEEKTATVTFEKYINQNNYKSLPEELIIPEKVSYDEVEYTVTAIGDDAFLYCESVKKVTLPATIQKLGKEAFEHCSSISEMTCYAAEPPVLGQYAFYGIDCKSALLYVPIASIDKYENAEQWKEFVIVEMSNRVKVDELYYIFDEVNKTARVTFEKFNDENNYKSLPEELIIPENVTYAEVEYAVTAIGDDAFLYCEPVKKVTLPATIQKLGKEAFEHCSSISEMTCYAAEPPVLGEDVFYGYDCSKITLYVPNPSIDKYEAAEQWKEFDIKAAPMCGDHLLWEIKDGVLTITGNGDMWNWTKGNHVPWFNYHGEITSVQLPGGLTSIGDNAFYGCESFTSIDIPAGVTSIGDNAFDACKKLTSIAIPVGVTTIGTYAFDYCSELTSINVSEENEHYCDIDGVLFNKQKTVLVKYPERREGNSYTVPEGVTKLEIRAFRSADLLETIILPKGITKIEAYTFSSADLLETIILPDGLTSIGVSAFSACKKLVSIDFPASVTNIDILAFNDCIALTSVTCRAVEPPVLGDYVFRNIDRKNIPLYVPKASIDKYKAAEQWKEFNPIESYEFAVTFLDKDGNLIEEKYVLEGGSATAPDAPEVEGYTFTGWDKEFDNVTSDLTVKAVYAIKTFTVRFYDKDGKVISTQTVNWNEAALEPELAAWEGHTFIGWSADFGHVKSDLDIKPIYDVQVYKVTFLGFNDTELKVENVEYGKNATAPDAPDVEGYTFTGWDKEFDNVTSDLTVKALYDINIYTVTFLGFNDIELKVENVEYGGSATAPDAPDVEGYTFTGWDKEFDNVTSDLTVKALYDINIYTVTFLGFNDTELKVENVEYGKNATAPDAPDVEGYTFTGWDKEFDNVTSDLTVKALYDINIYTVTFLGFNDIELKVENVEYGGSATAPDAPDVEGYTFTGWDKEFGNVTSDLTVKALYDINIYTVTFLGFNDIELKVENVEYGGSATAPDTPDVEGYTFTGWDKEFDNVTSDLTVKAVYEKNPDLTPQNLSAELTEKDGDTEITLSWDKVAGVPSYEVKLTVGEKELGAKNTFGKNTVTELLSAVVKEYNIKPGTYLVSWAVRSTDIMGTAVSDWAEGIAFQITVKDTRTGVTDVTSDYVPCTKVLRDGVLYLMYKGTMYDVQGRKVE